MIKYINIQTALCPICTAAGVNAQANLSHLATKHNVTFEPTLQLIDRIGKAARQVEREYKRMKKEGGKRHSKNKSKNRNETEKTCTKLNANCKKTDNREKSKRDLIHERVDSIATAALKRMQDFLISGRI